MKKLMLALLFGVSFAAFSSHEKARDAFMSDPDVKLAIEKAKGPQILVDTKPGSVFLSRLCGFAGCEETYLVTVGVHHDPGANPQSWSIVAKVKLTTYFGTLVELIEL